MLTNQSISLNNSTELSSSLIEQAESWEEFVNLGQELRCHKDSSQWLLGLTALKVQTKYGENSLGRFAKEIGVGVNSLEVYRWVVSKYLESDPNFEPVPKVSFTLYRSVANLPPPTRDALLKQADEGDYSVERMRLEKARTENLSVNPRPKVKLSYCEVHRKWMIQVDNPELFEKLHE